MREPIPTIKWSTRLDLFIKLIIKIQYRAGEMLDDSNANIGPLKRFPAAILSHSQPRLEPPAFRRSFIYSISNVSSAFVSAPLKKLSRKHSFSNFSAASLPSWYSILTERNVAGVSRNETVVRTNF